MTNRQLFLTAGVVFSLMAQPVHGTVGAVAADLPNVLWITVEDMSPNLGCYGDRYATTPGIDQLAEESVRFTNAFATAPVCSPARSCLITGVYATSLGTGNLRSNFPLPPEIVGFPSYLRSRGYFCTNNVKTDYNTSSEPKLIQASWDECSNRAHWRHRPAGKPFFSVFNLMVTHQSRTSVWPFEQFEREVGSRLKMSQRHAPDLAPIPPYYPDTPTVRRTLARYYDCISVMDRQVVQILQQLEDDGLLDDTIVFFYSDHGAGLPRGKRVLYDSGLRVPLLIRFPAKYQHGSPSEPGTVSDRLVSFVDFPPTVLSLVGIEIPQYMQGHAFLGAAAEAPRRYVYGARDRVDEAYELSRSVRDKRFLYIRNFLPHQSWNQPERYSDSSPMRREITRLAQQGKLSAAQLSYAAPRKPRELLFDTEQDPHQVHNLAEMPAHRQVLQRMRTAHRQWVLETRDLGFLPESMLWQRSAGRAPWYLRNDTQRYPLEQVLAAAEQVGQPDSTAQHMALLNDSDAAIRFWGVTGFRCAADPTAGDTDLRRLLDDPAPAVRVAAAALLVRRGDEPALQVLVRQLKGPNLDIALRAARHLQLLGQRARPALEEMQEVLNVARRREGTHPLYMFIRFSLEAALEQLGA